MASMKTADLLKLLQARFELHPQRHAGLAWELVRQRLADQPKACRALAMMEQTGGEPDVIGRDGGMQGEGPLLWADCTTESPVGRRSLCFDREALDGRKKNPPAGCASDLVAEIGAQLMTEAEYQALQQVGEFDLKTSSWLATPDEVRQLGGALFGDRRYGRVFTYHNGADSYYAARGFRCVLRT